MYCIHFRHQVRRPSQFDELTWSNFKVCQTHHIEPTKQWDAQPLPLADNRLDLAVTNMLWERQITVGFGLERLYREFFSEMRKVFACDGRMVALTTAPELLAPFYSYLSERREISLVGPRPHFRMLQP